MKRLYETVFKLIPMLFTLTPVSANWTSGYCRILRIGNVAIICIMNLRRATGTGGYIDVASMPSEVAVGDMIMALPMFYDGTNVKMGNFRVSEGKIQFNTGQVAPTYGVYSMVFYVAS